MPFDRQLSICNCRRWVKEKLHLTDGLIDQIVYRLYGLTEEEIRIVEERG